MIGVWKLAKVSADHYYKDSKSVGQSEFVWWEFAANVTLASALLLMLNKPSSV